MTRLPTAEAVASVLVLSACSMARMPELSRFDAQYMPYSSAEAISSTTFERPNTSGDLPQCVAAVVTNRGEVISDNAGSFVGAYSGTLYQANNKASTSGGSVIERTSKDGRSVVASGSTRYQRDALIKRSVRFTLMAKAGKDGTTYRFANIEQAQLDTGYANNDGYNPIGSWPGANPDLALQALESLADRLDSCMER